MLFKLQLLSLGVFQENIWKNKLELLDKRIGASATSFTSFEGSGDSQQLLPNSRDFEIVADHTNELTVLEGIDSISYVKATNKLIHNDPYGETCS